MPYCAQRAPPFRLNVGEVGAEALFAEAEIPRSERRHPAEARQQVPLHQNVVGDGDHIELAGLAIEIDDLAQRQAAVAPPGVHVKIAQQERFVPRHQVLTSTWEVSFGRR